MNNYTEISSPQNMGSPMAAPARRFSLPQLLGAVFVSALTAFAVTYHVSRPGAIFSTRLADGHMTQFASAAVPYVPITAPYAPVAAPETTTRGFVPTNICAYGRGACAGTVETPPGVPYPVYRQCTDGKTASMCKCFGVRGEAGKPTPVSVVHEMLLPNGVCNCVFVSKEGPETSHWAMILGCK